LRDRIPFSWETTSSHQHVPPSARFFFSRSLKKKTPLTAFGPGGWAGFSSLFHACGAVDSDSIQLELDCKKRQKTKSPSRNYRAGFGMRPQCRFSGRFMITSGVACLRGLQLPQLLIYFPGAAAVKRRTRNKLGSPFRRFPGVSLVSFEHQKHFPPELKTAPRERAPAPYPPAFSPPPSPAPTCPPPWRSASNRKFFRGGPPSPPARKRPLGGRC